MDKKTYIAALAAFLATNNTGMTGSELADHLNRNRFKTDYGSKYQGGRGTFKLIKSTYAWLASSGKQQEADFVAKAFVDRNDTPAYYHY